jgi:hypothetical protein
MRFWNRFVPRWNSLGGSCAGSSGSWTDPEVMSPGNFGERGQAKQGCKQWWHSRRYRALARQLALLLANGAFFTSETFLFYYRLA